MKGAELHFPIKDDVINRFDWYKNLIMIEPYWEVMYRNAHGLLTEKFEEVIMEYWQRMYSFAFEGISKMEDEIRQFLMTTTPVYQNMLITQLKEDIVKVESSINREIILEVIKKYNSEKHWQHINTDEEIQEEYNYNSRSILSELSPTYLDAYMKDINDLIGAFRDSCNRFINMYGVGNNSTPAGRAFPWSNNSLALSTIDTYTEGKIVDCYKRLKHGESFIPDAKKEDFTRIFMEDCNINEKITWKGSLAEINFFITGIKPVLKKNVQERLWIRTVQCFKPVGEGAVYKIKSLKAPGGEVTDMSRKSRLCIAVHALTGEHSEECLKLIRGEAL